MEKRNNYLLVLTSTIAINIKEDGDEDVDFITRKAGGDHRTAKIIQEEADAAEEAAAEAAKK